MTSVWDAVAAETISNAQILPLIVTLVTAGISEQAQGQGTTLNKECVGHNFEARRIRFHPPAIQMPVVCKGRLPV